MARLRPLSEDSDVTFGEGSHDVRNWAVRSSVDDTEVGTVHDVLLDENGRTRFLDIDLADGDHVLIPSGSASVDASRETVHVRGLDRDGLRHLPAYDGAPESITPEYTRRLSAAHDDAWSDRHHYERSDYSPGWRSRAAREDAERRRTETGRLARLDRLDDVDVAEHDPDPRGWTVVGRDGETVGRVDHVIGDTGAMKARYLTVELDDAVSREDRQVLLPVGHVRLDADRKHVITNALDRERAREIPAYHGESIDRDYETRLTRHYGEAYTEDRLYEHPRYRSDALSARRSS